MPSRLRTARPPSLPIVTAKAGSTTPSIAEARIGSGKLYVRSRYANSQWMSTSRGSRVRRDGTMAMSSNPYPRRAVLPRPISISMDPPVWFTSCCMKVGRGPLDITKTRCVPWPSTGSDAPGLYSAATGAVTEVPQGRAGSCKGSAGTSEGQRRSPRAAAWCRRRRTIGVPDTQSQQVRTQPMSYSGRSTRARRTPRGRLPVVLSALLPLLLAAAGLSTPLGAYALPTSPAPDRFGGSAGLPPLVFIDAGHGGPYSNANVNGVREKDVNLTLALELAAVLRADGLRVQVDRTTDTALALWDVPTWHWVSPPGMWRFIADGVVPRDVPYDDLQARVDMANQAGADVFVAIHNNGVTSSAARGTETYGPSIDGPGRRLAGSIQSCVIGRVGPAMNRGAKVEDFY